MDEQTELQLEALVRRARVIAAEIRELTETKKAIEDKIDSLVEVGWKVEIDGIPASKKTGNRTFSEALALAKMTAEQKQNCIETIVSKKAIRAIADSKGWTEECMVEPDDKTTIKLS